MPGQQQQTKTLTDSDVATLARLSDDVARTKADYDEAIAKYNALLKSWNFDAAFPCALTMTGTKK